MPVGIPVPHPSAKTNSTFMKGSSSFLKSGKCISLVHILRGTAVSPILSCLLTTTVSRSTTYTSCPIRTVYPGDSWGSITYVNFVLNVLMQ